MRAISGSAHTQQSLRAAQRQRNNVSAFRGLCAAAVQDEAAPIPNFERVAIVGAGPSGLFTARRLINARAGGSDSVCVDLYDTLPAPFGLARYGIAPDHYEPKRVQYSKGNFTDTAEHERVSFLCRAESVPPDLKRAVRPAGATMCTAGQAPRGTGA